MKLVLLALIFSANVMGGERIILKDRKKFSVPVNKETVRCSDLGYGLEELKINIAALDGWTIFDHTNTRFGDTTGLPCMTAGICKYRGVGDGFTINDVIQNNERTESIVIHRELIETREKGLDADNVEVCTRSLREELKTKVGGIEFLHSRGGADESLPLSACHF